MAGHNQTFSTYAMGRLRKPNTPWNPPACSIATVRNIPPFSPLILAEARTQVYGRCTHLKGCLAPRRAVYTGSADGPARRVSEHREGLIQGAMGR